MAVRAWTSGYDLYTPHNSVAFHPYSRKKRPPMFWENSKAHGGEGMGSALRVQGLTELGFPPAGSFDAQRKELYGLGSKRSADDFYDLLGIDRKQRRVVKDLCLWSTSGKMHRQLSPFLRADKKGIDYDAAFKELGPPAGIR